MANYINLVSLKCGRFDKRIPVIGKTDDEVKEIKSNLVYDKSKYILIITQYGKKYR